VYSLRQKVLIISADESDRETMRLLLGSMGCGWMLASRVAEALKLLSRETIAAAILDSRILSHHSLETNERWQDVVSFLPGRVLLLIGANDDARILNFVQENSLPSIKRDRLAPELWGSLEGFLRQPAGVSQGLETGRLTLDTFLQPLPVGIRYASAAVRHLLYETSSLSVDVSIERRPDSKSVALAGQILSKSATPRTFPGARVALIGHKGPLGFAVTNQSGEFLFEFEKEAKVVLEIEDASNHRVAIHSPSLSNWPAREEQASTGRNARRTRRARTTGPSRRPGSDKRKEDTGDESSKINT
jgi:hypothetical protein